MIKQIATLPSAPRQRIKRGRILKVSLSEEMLGRLVTLSELLGVPAGTVASLAMGEYITRQERSLGFLQTVSDSMGETFKSELGKALAGEQLSFPK